jgi:hypothetical protein
LGLVIGLGINWGNGTAGFPRGYPPPPLACEHVEEASDDLSEDWLGAGGEGGGDAASGPAPARGVAVKAGAVSVGWLSTACLLGAFSLAWGLALSPLATQPQLVHIKAVAVAMRARKRLALRSGPRSGPRSGRDAPPWFGLRAGVRAGVGGHGLG